MGKAVKLSPETSAGSGFLEMIASMRKGPGVLLLTDALQLLYLNHEAVVMNRRLIGTHDTSVYNGILANELIDFAEEIVENLNEKRDTKEWEHFQLTRVAFTDPPPILIRGIGIPASRSLLILMENLSDQHRAELNMNGHHRITEREQAVIKCLAVGMTNKQIAQCLKLSEHTVKDHLKHVMHKTETHTRTALLMRVGVGVTKNQGQTARPGSEQLASKGFSSERTSAGEATTRKHALDS